MNPVFPGRYTAQHEGPLVVFLIGMRVNRLLAVRKWWPVMQAMVPMISTLFRHPEKGFLGGHTFLSLRGPVMVQYWRSFEDLERFARSPSDPHLEAWKRFNRSVGSDGSVGIWHETYLVQPGAFEALYGNMPRFGLGQAAGHAPETARTHSARERVASLAEAPAAEGALR
jgi:hypothetical protein